MKLLKEMNFVDTLKNTFVLSVARVPLQAMLEQNAHTGRQLLQ
jgi:hypothetical protein